jgi:uncharacterized membrane protein YfcA
VSPEEILLAALLGAAGGLTGGLIGIGGGILFVPALALVLDLDQVDAEATSLLAVIGVGIVGAWRQYGYGNVRPRDGTLLGALGAGGAVLGVVAANALPERTLELLFAAVMLFFAARLARRALRV